MEDKCLDKERENQNIYKLQQLQQYMSKKNEIISLLKKRKELSESRIAIEITLNQGYTKKYLKELVKENELEIIKKGKYTYYKIKKEEK